MKSNLVFWIFFPILLLSCSKNDDNVNIDDNVDIPSGQNLYLKVIVDGVEYKYIQYLNSGDIPDNGDFKIASCGTNSIDGNLLIEGNHIQNSLFISGFQLVIQNPVSVGTVPLNCIYSSSGNGNPLDNATFRLTLGEKYYTNKYVKINNNCEVETLCADFSVTFTKYQNTLLGDVRGTFSGTLYEEATENCQSDIPHTVTGEFQLKYIQ